MTLSTKSFLLFATPCLSLIGIKSIIMKHLYLGLTGICMLGGTLSAQTTMQRVTLIEQVTSASCPPCASQNPAFKTFVDNNYNNSVKITYQRGGGSYIDPMWDFNPNETNGRVVTFYGVTHFPNTWMNGDDYGAPSSIGQNDLDNENNIPATFHIDASSQLINGNTEIQVDVTATSLQEYSAGSDHQTRLYIAVIENDVNYTSAPGTNGEEDFYWVMRKMLPNQNGTVIGQQTIGQINTVSETWTIDLSEVDPADLDVVVWVQNSSTGDVHQATRTSMAATTNPLSVDESNFAGVEVYPTIADHNVTLGLTLAKADLVQVDIIDATGKMVSSNNYTDLSNGYNTINISADDLTNGLYHIRIKSGNDVINKKFIVAK